MKFAQATERTGQTNEQAAEEIEVSLNKHLQKKQK